MIIIQISEKSKRRYIRRINGREQQLLNSCSAHGEEENQSEVITTQTMRARRDSPQIHLTNGDQRTGFVRECRWYSRVKQFEQ